MKEDIKPYDDLSYIEDISRLQRMQFSVESIEETSRIFAKLQDPMVAWRLRWHARAITASICVLCFITGGIIL